MKSVLLITEKTLQIGNKNSRRISRTEAKILLDFASKCDLNPVFRRVMYKDMRIMPFYECIVNWGNDKYGIWHYDERAYWIVQIAFDLLTNEGRNVKYIEQTASENSYCSPNS